LVVSFLVVVRDVLRDGATQRAFSKEDHLLEALVLDGQNESFTEGIQVGGAPRKSDSFDPGVA
jgi:hypothetical protein